MAGLMRDVAAVVAAPVGVVLEGGYELEALALSVAATMEALGGGGAVGAGAGGPGSGEVPVSPLAGEAAARLESWWPGLGAR
jgi:hypothetical protein